MQLDFRFPSFKFRTRIRPKNSFSSLVNQRQCLAVALENFSNCPRGGGSALQEEEEWAACRARVGLRSLTSAVPFNKLFPPLWPQYLLSSSPPLLSTATEEEEATSSAFRGCGSLLLDRDDNRTSINGNSSGSDWDSDAIRFKL